MEERGISVAKMMTLFSQIYPEIRGDTKKLGQFREELQRALSDPNVASFVIAVLRLDDDAKMGLFPETSTNMTNERPISLSTLAGLCFMELLLLLIHFS